MKKALRALPVVAGFCRRLGLGETIDRLCAVRGVAIATHATCHHNPLRPRHPAIRCSPDQRPLR